MTDSLLQQDAIIFHEMMAHLPLFSHPNPRQVAILHDHQRDIAHEVLKHPGITLMQETAETGSVDVLIIADEIKGDNYKNYFHLLHRDGILVQLSESPFHLASLKTTQHALQSAGFHDIHIIQFPQPSYPSGWRAAMLAVKYGVLKRPREKDIFNKSFGTRFYNLDIHKAAFAMPEFLRTEFVSD